MVGTIINKVPEVAIDQLFTKDMMLLRWMIVQPQFLQLHIKIENMMTRVFGYPMFGKKNRGNKKSQKDLSKLPHILLAIAIFIGKVYLTAWITFTSLPSQRAQPHGKDHHFYH